MTTIPGEVYEVDEVGELEFHRHPLCDGSWLTKIRRKLVVIDIYYCAKEDLYYALRSQLKERGINTKKLSGHPDNNNRIPVEQLGKDGEESWAMYD